MNRDQLVQSSKFLSLHLRHRPQQLGIALEPGGWVGVDELLQAAAQRGMAITRAESDEIVAANDKQRFSFDRTGLRIRANQGHSVAVDLQLPPAEPPAVLYHGTGERSVPAIERSGLSRMQRQHVHLSGDVETARRVGARHGRAVVFEVNAAAMRADGHLSFRSDNGVWLVDAVPGQYLRRYADA